MNYGATSHKRGPPLGWRGTQKRLLPHRNGTLREGGGTIGGTFEGPSRAPQEGEPSPPSLPPRLCRLYGPNSAGNSEFIGKLLASRRPGQKRPLAANVSNKNPALFLAGTKFLQREANARRSAAPVRAPAGPGCGPLGAHRAHQRAPAGRCASNLRKSMKSTSAWTLMEARGSAQIIKS